MNSEGKAPIPLPDREEELRVIDACLRGEWEEFRRLFEPYKERVYFLALSIVKDAPLARDIAQGSFIKVFQSLRWFDRRARFSTWLYRIAYRHALDQYRRRRRRDEFERAAAPLIPRPTGGDDALHESARRELREKLQAAIDGLPVGLRTVMVLRYVDECTFSEICEIVGCARGVLQRRLDKANLLLRKALGGAIEEHLP